MFEQSFQLHPIGHLRTATYKDDVGQDGFLIDTAEDDIGAESFRILIQLTQDFFFGETYHGTIHGILIAPLVNTVADAIPQVKKIHGPGVDLQLIHGIDVLTGISHNFFCCLR